MAEELHKNLHSDNLHLLVIITISITFIEITGVVPVLVNICVRTLLHNKTTLACFLAVIIA